jgi:hypothetical protein
MVSFHLNGALIVPLLLFSSPWPVFLLACPRHAPLQLVKPEINSELNKVRSTHAVPLCSDLMFVRPAWRSPWSRGSGGKNNNGAMQCFGKIYEKFDDNNRYQ